MRRRGAFGVQQVKRRQSATRADWAALYTPTDRQRIFHESGAKYKLFGGAMGGGKSVALVGEINKLSIMHPGNRIYLCRQTLTDLKRTTMVTFFQRTPEAFIQAHYTNDRTILYVNGSEVIYGALGGTDSDLERIKSMELGAFAIDEASEVSESMFFMLASRLRWRLPDQSFPPYHGLLTSNPEPGWVKDRFIEQKLPEHEFVPSLPKDNPYLPADYYSDLRALYTDEWVRRYLDGSWDVFEGQIYKEFDVHKHIVDFEVSPFWEKYRVIDHGYTNPTACLWVAIDFDGRMLVYDEHYEAGLTIQENAAIIQAKHPLFKGITLCDPSMKHNTMQLQGRVWAVADEYRQYGIICISPYQGDTQMEEALGINLVKTRMKTLGADAKPMLLIHPQCRNTIKEIQKYRWRNVRNLDRNAPEVAVDKDNHAVDCLRYAVIWRPTAANLPQPPSVRSRLARLMSKFGVKSAEHFYAGW